MLDNYDFISLSDKTTAKYSNSDGSPGRVIEYHKQIDGSMCVVEAVPDAKTRTLYILGMWKNKNPQNKASLSAPSDAEMLSPARLTSETRDRSLLAFDNRLSNNSDNVNVEALSSASRAGFEPQMPIGTLDSKRKVNEVRRIIERVTGIPVRERQVRMKNTLGYIDHLHGVIRSKSPNDIATLLHEFGHAVDKRFKLSESFPKYAGSVKLFL